MDYQPTPQQAAIFDDVANGGGNVLIKARAGCGKTFAITKAVDIVAEKFPNAEVAVVAFNKAIANEVKEKLEKAGHKNWKKYQAATLHSLGYGLLRFALNNPTIDDNKVKNIAKGMNNPAMEDVALRDCVVRLVRYAKAEGFGFFNDRQIGDYSAWYKMADHYGINGFDETTDMDIVVSNAISVYRASLSVRDVIDFDDMVLMPLVLNLRVRFQKDFLFVDEAQDLSRSRQALVRKFIKPTGRMFIVGDDRQAIYGFSGADSDALHNMAESLSAKELPLTFTWRCPKAVVAMAQTIVPDITAAPDAPEGHVEHLDALPEVVARGDAILCRNTAPLIDIAYRYIRNKIGVKVEGRDIGEGLKVMLNRWKVKTIDLYLDRLEDYEAREIQKAQAKDDEKKIEQIVDKCETLRTIANCTLMDGKDTVRDMVDFVDNLFADGDDTCAILATYHRSKGREWDNVYLYEHEQRCPTKYARKPWELHQEANLAYVAYTRSKANLYFVG